MIRSCALCFFLFAPVFLAAACAGAKAPAPDDLVHRRFVLVSVDGLPFAASKAPDIAFNEGFRVSGQICNRYMGQGKLEGGVLAVAQMASTKMLCADGALNRFEARFAAMLTAGAEADLSGGILTLRQGGHVLVYAATDGPR
jgi:heat shock protein HslJ